MRSRRTFEAVALALSMLLARCAAGDALTEFRDTPEGWERVAAFLAQYAKWPAAAAAQEHAPPSLLLARYRLNAGDYDGAADVLEHGDSRATQWLRIELALMRNDAAAARRELEALDAMKSGAADDIAANLLYRGHDLRAADVDETLRARVALASRDPERALDIARSLPRVPEARMTAALALEQLGQTSRALRELDALTSDSLVLRDRVLYNQANIAARHDDEHYAPDKLYNTAVIIAEKRERDFAEAVKRAELPRESPLNRIVLPAVRDSREAAPEARNNLGHYLLDVALRTDDDKERRWALGYARRELRAAAESRDYATPQYAYAGLAHVYLVDDDRQRAQDAAEEALAWDARNLEALEVAAALGTVESASLIVSSAREVFPNRYGHQKWDAALQKPIEQASAHPSEAGDALLGSVALWNGDLDALRARVDAAKAQYASAPWVRDLEAQLLARTGHEAEAMALFASVAESLQTAPLTRRWETAALRSGAGTYAILAGRNEFAPHAQRANALIAAVTPTELREFPWEPRCSGYCGAVRNEYGDATAATVTLARDGIPLQIASTDDGAYRFPNVPAGTYDVTVNVRGLAPVTSRVYVEQGQPTRVDVAVNTLAIDSPMFEPGALPQRQQQITSLPSNDRQVQALLQNSTLSIDGATLGDASTGSSSFLLDIIQEVQVATSGYSAEFGRNTIDAVTKSGTNTLKGEATAEWQPSTLRSNVEPIAVPYAMRADRNQRTLRVSLGGPIIPQHFWYFVLGELRNTDGALDDESRAGKGTFRARQLFAKLTADLPLTISSALKAMRDRETRSGVVDDLGGAAFGDETSTRRDGRRDLTTVGASLTKAFGTIALAELKADLHDDQTSLRPETEAGDAIQFRDVRNAFFTHGGVGFINDGRETKGRDLAFASSIWVPRTEIRFGVQHAAEDDRVRDRLSGGEIADVIGDRIVFRHFPGNTVRAAIEEATRSETGAAFAQAEWRSPASRWKINAGLRGDRQEVRLPSDVRFDTPAVWQPRIEVRFDPNNDTQLSAAYGRFADVLTANDRIAFGTQRLLGVPPLVDDGLRQGSSEKMQLRFSRSFDQGLRIELTGNRVRLLTMIEDYFCHTRVVARCIGNPGRGAMGGPEARRTSTSLNAWAKDSLQVFDERVDWQLDYTWSRSRGNTEMPELTRVFGIDPYARTAFDRPQFVPPDQPLANERRHVASAWSSWNHEPFATSLSARWSSGVPLARFGYSDFYGRYVSFLRPRGSEGHTPNLLETSFDVVYSQKVLESSNLELKLAVDNLFNRQTMLSADQRWAFEENANSASAPQNPNYLRAMTRVAPRSVRLSAKLVF